MSLEYSLLLTATLCLIALGAVMVFSASSSTQLLGGTGDGAYYFKRTIAVAAVGLILMRLVSLRGLRVMRSLTPVLLVISIALLVVVLVPGIGTSTNGARRWIGSGAFIQVQPSELAKLALVLYGARLLAMKPQTVRDLRTLTPFLLVVASCCLLVVAQPDLGTAMVTIFAVGAVLIAGGAKLRHLALVAACIGVLVLVVALFQPYVRDRMFGFLHPGADATGSGFQAAQAKLALGSGELFGVGLGQGVQKAFYLPEAHTDMIAAVIGEEIGLMGITVIVALFSMYGYAGLRTARNARNRYEKLLAAGLTSLVLVQASINLFAVMGLAPVTGVPLPFVSYGNSSLLVMMVSTGLILNVARRLPARAPSGAGARQTRGGTRRRPAGPRIRGRPAPAYATAGGFGKLRLLEGGRSETRSSVDRSRAESGGGRGGHRGSRSAGDRRR